MDLRKPSVLVVDDDALSRATVSSKIAKFSDVVEAGDGAEALRHLRSMPFDLVIVDLEMPGLDGFDLIKCTRGDPKLNQIPIVVLTGNETRHALEAALTAGATSYLLKPLNWKAFGGHIRHVLDLAYRAGHLAMHDPLTGLPNRALLADRMQQVFEQVKPGMTCALHLLDLDQFKEVNDELGHPAGDQLLKAVAFRLQKLIRDCDTVARMGGDEFAILQTNIIHPEDAEALATRVVEAVSGSFDIYDKQVNIGTSIGIALCPIDGNTPERSIQAADLALYQAKAAGRGVYMFYDAAMDEEQQSRRALENDLRQAIDRGQITLHYQPLVDIATQNVTGFEALMRWRHPTLGDIAPDVFIPMAEQNGYITALGKWAIETACATAAKWPEEHNIAVNISPLQFRSSDLFEIVEAAVTASGINPRRLEIEITESACLNDETAVVDVLARLRALGVRIVTDDFGMGYSSLALLKKFQVDKIKIDRCFVKDISDSETSLNIVRAVVALADALGISSTAEGIEDNDQLNSVMLAGCKEVQGYLVSRALPEDAVAPFLLSNMLASQHAATKNANPFSAIARELSLALKDRA